MSAFDEPHVVVSFEPKALERCYAVADVLEEVYGRSYAEYGLIGLAARSKPLLVAATPLLTGQHVSTGSVHQSGHNVLSMRHEISTLSKRLRLPLVPVAFIHRHPYGCEPSIIDDEFLGGPFIDQVSTVVSFSETRKVIPGDSHYACLDRRAMSQPSHTKRARRTMLEVEFSIAFSLIVNKNRDHYVYAARKERCPYCAEVSIRFVPAELAVSPDRALSQWERNRIRKELESEVAAKVRFDCDAAHMGITQ